MADVVFKVVNFTTTTGTGTIDVTNADFDATVKAAIFIGTNATADDTPVNDEHFCVGFTDGTRENVMAFHFEDASDPMDTDGSQRSDRVLTWINDTPSEIAGLGFNSWIGANNGGSGDDGVRLDIDNQSASDFRCTCILIGGDDVQARADFYDDLGTTTGSFNVTDPGWQADIVFAVTNRDDSTSPGLSSGHFFPSLGCAVPGTAQACVNSSIYAGTGTTTAYGRVNNNNTMHVYRASTLIDVDITSHASGFTVTNNVTPSLANTIFTYLALEFSNGPDFTLRDMSWPTSGDRDVSGLGYRPGFGLTMALQGVDTRNTNDASGADAFALSIVAFDDTNIGAITASHEDGASVANTWTTHSDSLNLYERDGSTASIVGTFDGFNSDGFGWTLTTHPTVQAILGWELIFEDPTPPITIPDVTYDPPTGYAYVAHDGLTIPNDSVLYYYDGTATGGTTTTATTTLDLTLNEVQNLVWNNKTNAETVTIASNTAGPNSTITFDSAITATSNGDLFAIEADIDTNDQIQYELVTTVATDSADVQWAIVDITDDSHTSLYTATVTDWGVINAQDENDYDNVGDNGTFAGGTSYAVSDTITLTGGTIVTVDVEGGPGIVQQFTVDSSADIGGHTADDILTQVSTSGSGTGFTLTLGSNNLATNLDAGTYDVSMSVKGVLSLTLRSEDAEGFAQPLTANLVTNLVNNLVQ